MRWRLRRTKEDSVATLPPCHQRPAGGIISQGMEDTSSPRTFQSPADVPLRPGSRLWWRGGLQRLFFFYIQCQALTHTYIHTGGQISTLTGKMLYANTIPQQKNPWNISRTQYINYSFAFSLTLTPFLSFLLITVQLPVESIPTKYSHSAGCSHYELYIITSRRIGDPVWSMTSFYSKAFRDQDCEYSTCEAETVYCERDAADSMHTVFRGMLNENDIQTFVILRHYRTMPRGRKPQKPFQRWCSSYSVIAEIKPAHGPLKSSSLTFSCHVGSAFIQSAEQMCQLQEKSLCNKVCIHTLSISAVLIRKTITQVTCKRSSLQTILTFISRWKPWLGVVIIAAARQEVKRISIKSDMILLRRMKRWTVRSSPVWNQKSTVSSVIVQR